MKYPCVIQPRKEASCYGVVIPDLPGCISCGDTLDEVMKNAQQATELWIEEMIDNGEVIPKASSIEEVYKNPDWAGWIVSFVSIDLTKLSGKTERVNICLPSRIIRRLDEKARLAGESRSAFIAHLVLNA